ncbi:hypothetical protein [Kozakia baliensis]|uniref:hypothetical protein n=1 Tax=Kozakia baliensis TaxID=153496 RepID=UPI0006900295|nr:hypothetical protein [Kozakia baliensis]
MTNTTKQPREVRSRDEQIDLLARTLEVALFQPYKEAEKQAAEFILEAEQRARMEKSGEAVAWEFDPPEYHDQGMGCGLEDRGIHDRYEAMAYGWDQAIERCIERIPEELYRNPPTDAQAEKVARLEAENERLREALAEAHAALNEVIEGAQQGYKARNGKWMMIQADDGERCDIIHSDITVQCESALNGARAALASDQKGGREVRHD